MRNLFKFVVFPAIMFSLLACNRPMDDTDLSEQQASGTSMTMFARGSEWTVEQLGDSLSNDEDFLTLAENLENYFTRSRNLEEMERIAALENIGDEDKEKFIHALGFETDEEVYNFNEQNYNRLQNIYRNYSLSDLSFEDQNHVLTIAFEDFLQQTDGKNCERKFKNCKGSAYAAYGQDAIMCGGIAGALAGPSAGIGGILVGVGCITMAVVKLNRAVDVCIDNLEDCQGV